MARYTCHRVGRRLPALQDDVCVLRWPPAFAAVPQYLVRTGCTPAPLRTGQAAFPNIRLLGESFSSRADTTAVPVPAGPGRRRGWGRVGHHRRGRTSRRAYPCRLTTIHRSLYSVDGSPRTGDSHVGTFTQRGLAISRVIARPLQHTGPHLWRRGHPAPSFHIGHGTRGTTRKDSPRAGASLAWVLTCLRVARCCLGPRGPVSGSSITRVPHGLRPHGKDRHPPK